MQEFDIPSCARIINFIIRQGGTTANEEEFSLEAARKEFLEVPPIAIVVEYGGRIVGFQNAYDYAEGVYSIGSFTDQEKPVRGAGRALFAATLEACRQRGGTAILARITSDNLPGLAYYSKMGFQDDHVLPKDVIRKNGTVVDRIVKRYAL
jgi:L-amino acid N-acyltransferase YncA